MPEVYDLVIIGGGPAGCSAAMYAARGGLKTIILDKNPASGALALAYKIFNYPGQCQEISGRELLDLVRQQAISFGATYKQSQVLAVDFSKELKEITATDGVYSGKTVLVATGARGRKERIKGETDFVGKGVSYCAICDAPLFQDADVAVIGDSEEAAEDIILLGRFAKKIYAVTTTKELRTEPETLAAIKNNPKVETKNNYYLKEIKGTNLVSSIIVSNNQGREEEIKAEGVFIHLPGNEPIVDFLGYCLKLEEGNCIAVNQNQETCLEGVFAAGDVACRHMKQAVVAASEGAVAAIAVDKYLNKRTTFRFSR